MPVNDRMLVKTTEQIRCMQLLARNTIVMLPAGVNGISQRISVEGGSLRHLGFYIRVRSAVCLRRPKMFEPDPSHAATGTRAATRAACSGRAACSAAAAASAATLPASRSRSTCSASPAAWVMAAAAADATGHLRPSSRLRRGPRGSATDAARHRARWRRRINPHHGLRTRPGAARLQLRRPLVAAPAMQTR